MPSSEIFNNLCLKIGQLPFGRTEVDRNIISKTLDELNSLNYHENVVKNPTKAVLLVNQLCSFVPTDDGVLMAKSCKFITNLVKYQNISIEGRTLTISVQWCLQALKINSVAVVDILATLEALIKNTSNNTTSLIDSVIRDITFMLSRDENLSQDIILKALECLETCIFSLDNKVHNTNTSLNYTSCAKIFIYYLCSKKSFDVFVLNKIMEVCLIGLRNIITQYPEYLRKDLGLILGIIKSYMIYGIKGINFLNPEKILPSTLSIPEMSNGPSREKKGGKVTKQRKHRASGLVNKKEKKGLEDVGHKGYSPATMSFHHDSSLQESDQILTGQAGIKSDSDFSDSEGGRLIKISHQNGKIRFAALNLFYHTVTHTEKPIIFSYWSSFLPEGPSSGYHTLMTCILKDPSTKCRIAGLNILLQLLNMAKLYLSHAECSDKSTSFTPFSVVLGLTLIELHRGLNLALSEVSVPVLTQVLKCVAALVQSTPYHKMGSGLITKLVRNIRGLVYHKDASVQVLALIVMGCILTSEPVIPETILAITRLCKIEVSSDSHSVLSKEKNEELTDTDNFEFAEFSDDDETIAIKETRPMPWLLKKCLNNLDVNCQDEDKKPLCDVPERFIPAPVRLESLQVLSAMTQNYFKELTAPYLEFITTVLGKSLNDKYSDLRLHSGRAVDFIGQAIHHTLSAEDVAHKCLSLNQCLNFWEVLLSGPLVSLLQDEQHANLRAVGCDCLGSIGPQVFNHLPRSKQILCVTLLFACAKDEECIVKGAAVRALAICVLYPSLRSDAGFVEDTAGAVHGALKDDNLTVKIKASWSLGNLSDALVINSKSQDGTEKLPDAMLLKLIEISVQCSTDNEKIRMNVVRAIGNLLQLVDSQLMERSDFKHVCEQAFMSLVKNCTTGSNAKVRWNACYALGNALKNDALYKEFDNSSCKCSIFNSLIELVVGFKNFKVRINAAVALASPPTRDNYGQFFIPVWTALLKALENSQNMDDFTEYKHRDNLIEQLCLALGHLTVLLTVSDLNYLEELLKLYLEIFKTHMHKVLEKLVPEKSTELFSASCFLDNLELTSNLDDGKKHVIKNLKEVFNIE